MTVVTGFDAVEIATADARYGRLAYFRDDDPIGASLQDYGEWAQLELEVLLPLVRPGDTVVDVGANIGTHTLAFARAVGAHGRVLAYEPQTRVFELLERNVRANGYDNVTLCPAAAGAERGVRHVPAVDYGAHVNVGAVSLLRRPNESSYAVDVVPLDALELDAVRLIKIDVEGMESDVVRGAMRTIRGSRPFLSVECNSLDAGAAAVCAVREAEYVFCLNQTAAYNPANYRANGTNRFGSRRESSILCVPRELAEPAGGFFAAHPSLTPFTTVDELARRFVRVPIAEEELEELKRLRYRIAKYTFERAEGERLAARIAEQRAADHTALEGRCAEAEARTGAADARAQDAEQRLQLAQASLTAAQRETAAADEYAALALRERIAAEELAELERGRASAAEARAGSAEQRGFDAEQRAAIAEQRAATAEQSLAAAEQSLAAAEQSGAAAQWRATTAMQRAAAAEQRAAAAEQRAAAAEQHAAAAEQRGNATRAAAAAAEREAACAHATELHARDAVLASLLRSRSWRLTAPLRAFKRAVFPSARAGAAGRARE